MKHETITYYTCDRCGRRYMVEQDIFTVYSKNTKRVADLCGPCSTVLEDWFCKYNKVYQSRKEGLRYEVEEAIDE